MSARQQGPHTSAERRWPCCLARWAEMDHALGRIEALASTVGPSALGFASLQGLEASAEVPATLRNQIRDYFNNLPGYSREDWRRARVQHELRVDLLTGAAEPLVAGDPENLGLDEAEAE